MIMVNILHPFRVRKIASERAEAIDRDNIKRLEALAEETKSIKEFLKLDIGTTGRISLAIGYKTKKHVR